MYTREIILAVFFELGLYCGCGITFCFLYIEVSWLSLFYDPILMALSVNGHLWKLYLFTSVNHLVRQTSGKFRELSYKIFPIIRYKNNE